MLIRKKSAQLLHGNASGAEEAADFEQELAAHQWVAAKGYDPSRSKATTFARAVLDNKAASIVEQRRAAKRSPTAPATPGLESGEDHAAEVIDLSDLRASELLREESADLGADLARSVAKMPPRLRSLCELLSQGTITDAATASQRSRDSIYSDLAVIRRHFERAGLREYLGSDSFAASPVPNDRRQA